MSQNWRVISGVIDFAANPRDPFAKNQENLPRGFCYFLFAICDPRRSGAVRTSVNKPEHEQEDPRGAHDLWSRFTFHVSRFILSQQLQQSCLIDNPDTQFLRLLQL